MARIFICGFGFGAFGPLATTTDGNIYKRKSMPIWRPNLVNIFARAYCMAHGSLHGSLALLTVAVAARWGFEYRCLLSAVCWSRFPPISTLCKSSSR